MIRAGLAGGLVLIVSLALVAVGTWFQPSDMTATVAAGPDQEDRTASVDPRDPTFLEEGSCLFEDDLLSRVASSTQMADRLYEIESVPCDGPHDTQVVIHDVEFFSDADPYPGAAQLNRSAAQACVAAVEAQTGVPFDQSAHLYAHWIFPDERTWEVENGRGLLCLVTDYNKTAASQV